MAVIGWKVIFPGGEGPKTEFPGGDTDENRKKAHDFADAWNAKRRAAIEAGAELVPPWAEAQLMLGTDPPKLKVQPPEADSGGEAARKHKRTDWRGRD